MDKEEKSLQKELWDVEKKIQDLLLIKQKADLEYRQYLEARNSALKATVECKQLVDQLERKLAEVRMMADRVLDVANIANHHYEHMGTPNEVVSGMKALIGKIDTTEDSYNQIVRRAMDLEIGKEHTRKYGSNADSVV
jgi:hypothetical protein